MYKSKDWLIFIMHTLIYSFLMNVPSYAKYKRYPKSNVLVKFADDITVSAPVKLNSDSASMEVENIENWAMDNRMSLICQKHGKCLCAERPPNLYHH